MGQWFLLLDRVPLPAARNMARDEFLFQRCHQKKAGFFRLYFWEIPTFSFGVSQKIHKAVNLDYIEKNGYGYVRRITGGKTVLHHEEITYAVASSEDIFHRDHDLYQSYKLISGVLVDAFRQIGVDAYLSGGMSSSSLSKSSNPCFSFPTPNEIEIQGKKIVGSAQKRDNQALLQHGSIPLKMDYRLYADGTHSRPAIIQRSMTTLSDVSDRSGEDLIQSLVSSFQSFIGEPFKEYIFSKDEQKEIAQIEKKYRSREWNFIL
jgi:lipoate-protein ligase A